MEKLLKYKPKHYGDEMVSIESILNAALIPVVPRPEFVGSLQRKVMAFSFPDVTIVEKKPSNHLIVLVVSVLSATLLLGVWVRLLIGLGKAIGTRVEGKGKEHKRPELSAQTMV